MLPIYRVENVYVPVKTTQHLYLAMATIFRNRTAITQMSRRRRLAYTAVLARTFYVQRARTCLCVYSFQIVSIWRESQRII